MLTVPVRKPTKNQLYFDFAQDEKKQCSAAPRIRKNTKEKKLKSPIVPSDDFRDLCALLYSLARKHLAPTSFGDFCLLARCTKLLQTLGVAVEPTAEMQAHVVDAAATLVTRAPEYRLLRSRAIAGLATVADLADRLPAKGSAEYKRGMRDAYQHASDIAAFFMDDLEQFQFPQKGR